MPNHKETFQGCSIEIENETELTINGKLIDYEWNKVTDEWSSRYLPYTNYGSLLDLARAIARDTVEFSVNH